MLTLSNDDDHSFSEVASPAAHSPSPSPFPLAHFLTFSFSFLPRSPTQICNTKRMHLHKHKHKYNHVRTQVIQALISALRTQVTLNHPRTPLQPRIHSLRHTTASHPLTPTHYSLAFTHSDTLQPRIHSLRHTTASHPLTPTLTHTLTQAQLRRGRECPRTRRPL